MKIAERKFIIDSSQERIWSLLLKSVLRFMPFEKMRPLSENSVSALLRVKMGIITMPMNMEVEVAETVAPERMVALLRSRGMGGMVWVKQRATFSLAPAGEGKTEVSCEISEEGMGILVRIFLLPRVKTVARESFDGLEQRLKQWA